MDFSSSSSSSSSCFCHSQMSLKMNCWAPALVSKVPLNTRRNQPASLAVRGMKSDLSRQRIGGFGSKLSSGGSSLGGSRVIIQLNFQRTLSQRKSSRVSACWLPSSEIASNAFTVGTAAVLPFYTIMVVAPKAELTRKVMKSSIPYIVLGLLYAYLLCLSWTPDTIQLMFASKYWLPELPGIAKMFSNEVTLASAWIHLLTIDLFAARSISWRIFVGLCVCNVLLFGRTEEDATCRLSNYSFSFETGRFIMTDCRMILKPAILCLCACCFAPLELLLTSSPKL